MHFVDVHNRPTGAGVPRLFLDSDARIEAESGF
jgi:hypothetical protein